MAICRHLATREDPCAETFGKPEARFAEGFAEQLVVGVAAGATGNTFVSLAFFGSVVAPFFLLVWLFLFDAALPTVKENQRTVVRGPEQRKYETFGELLKAIPAQPGWWLRLASAIALGAGLALTKGVILALEIWGAVAAVGLAFLYVVWRREHRHQLRFSSRRNRFGRRR